jgi:death-on-curing protein
VSAPVFLEFSEIDNIHQRSIERFGGTLGVRDRNALESAIFHPQNVYLYGNGDLFDIAAAYAFHIAEAQAYLDGNKRTGIATALEFLTINGVSISHDSMPIYDVMIAIAERRATRDDLANKLRQLFGK